MKSLTKGVVTWSYHQYRSNAEKEYDNFWKALFRELIQNSSDAGSSRIELFIDKDKIQCRDDGCGMSLDIIQNKLLVIGGSQKAKGAVGGLGKAKELLFFSQPNWEIITNDHVVKGQGGEYEIFENDKPIKGTHITLHQPEEQEVDMLASSATQVATSCYINADIYINSNQMHPYYPKGRLVKTLPGLGRLYITKTYQGDRITDQYRMLVCVNGCWMFSRWIGEHEGHIILDVDSSETHPLDIMVASRDNFQYEYATKLDSIIHEIVRDKRSALHVREPVINLIRGTGEVYVSPSDEEIDDMAKVFSECDKPSSDTLDAIGNTNENHQLEVERLKDIITQMRSSINIEERVAAYDQILNYEPDFIVYEDTANDKWTHGRINQFMKTQKASTIAQVWTETVKQVLWDANIPMRFTAGFMFDKEVEAMRMVKNSKEFYLINPLFVPPTGVQNKVVFVNYMRTTAIHEITHHFYPHHDEDFMSKYHEIESKTWRSHRLYARIGTLR